MKDWLEPSVIRWPEQDLGPWEITLRWRSVDDETECSGLTIDPVESNTAGSVTGTLLRSIPVAALVADARQARYAENRGEIFQAVATAILRESDIGAARSEDAERSDQVTHRVKNRDGRSLYGGSLTHYTDVAKTYSVAIDCKMPPLVAVAEHWATSRSTAARWVATARAEGLLPPTAPGRPKGNPIVLTNPTTEKDS